MCFEQVEHRLRQLLAAAVVLFDAAGDAELVERRGTERIEHQHAVVRGSRAPGLADDHRVLDLAGVAHAGDAVHDVARVLVDRVVHRRFEVRAAAVVVDAEPAADVDVLHAGAHQLELGVDVRQLVDRILDAADVLQLAAGMAVNQLQAVEHLVLAQRVDQLEDLADEQPELRFLAGRVAPAPGAFARQLDAHADARAHLVLVRVAQHQLELVEILDDRNDGAAELGREDHGLDIAVVLEAVADDHAIRRAFGHRHDRQQLGLGAGLQAEVVFGAVAVHLFDHEPLLVHLDREHRAVAVLVVVLGDGLRERLVQTRQAVMQDVGEAHDDRRGEIARLESFDDFEQIDVALGRAVGPHYDVPGLVDAEVRFAPRSDLVQVERVLAVPRRTRREFFRGLVQGSRGLRSRQFGANDSRNFITLLQRLAPDHGSIRSTSRRRVARRACRRAPSRAAGCTP